MALLSIGASILASLLLNERVGVPIVICILAIYGIYTLGVWANVPRGTIEISQPPPKPIDLYSSDFQALERQNLTTQEMIVVSQKALEFIVNYIQANLQQPK